tara:strand:+ start:10 stop:1008 length:999 start_codon:yes stop_codon:yes gene_type:complete
MAVLINDVYQKVLAIANKEQRGYITPQEFNLFANQAQMEIFDAYFFDKGQYNRLPVGDTPYADLDHLLEEKISIFKKRHQSVRVENKFGDAILPDEVYRLDDVVRFGLTGESETSQKNVEEISEHDLGIILGSPLAKPNKKRPVYVRTGANSIKIYPFSDTPSASAVWFFTNGSVTTSNNSATVSFSTSISNYEFLSVGTYVYSAETPSHLAVGTVINSINVSNNTATVVLSNSPTALWASVGGYELAFASNDIYCNYVKKPETVKWTYTVVQNKALYDGSADDKQDFELHGSEENNLIIKILQLAGISMKDLNLAQIAGQKDLGNEQKQKQ